MFTPLSVQRVGIKWTPLPLGFSHFFSLGLHMISSKNNEACKQNTHVNTNLNGSTTNFLS